MRLFNCQHVPVVLRAWSGATEKAPQHDETKVVKVTLEVLLTPALASAFLPGDGELKNVAFKAAADGSVRPFLRTAGFNIPTRHQTLTIFSTPDSPVAAICFDHVRFMKTVSLRIDVKTATLVLRATVGPCGPQEYAYLGDWHRSQRFLTFDEADPALAFEGAQPSEADEKARRPYTPEFEDTRDEQPAAAAAEEAGHRYPDTSKKKRAARRAKLRAVAPKTEDEPSEDVVTDPDDIDSALGDDAPVH